MTSPSVRRGIVTARATAPPMTSDEAAKNPQRKASSTAPGPGPSVLLGEGLSQPRLVLVGEVRVDQLGVGPVEGAPDLVDDRVAGHDEERRRAGRDLLADALDEVLVDADVGQRARQGPGRGADGQAQQRDEEDQAEQEAPEGAAERPGPGEVVEVAGLRLLLALGPAHDRRVLHLDELLALQLLQRAEGVLGALGRVELPDSEGGHVVASLSRVGWRRREG